MFSRTVSVMTVALLHQRATHSLTHHHFSSRKTWQTLCGSTPGGRCRLYCSAVEGQRHAKMSSCWKCNAPVTSMEFFCSACNAIQPPSETITYFDLMASPKTFDVNTAQLTEKYKELQWKLHPDKFSDVSEEEKQLSEEQSSRVNEAYNTLLKPLSRGVYLLNLNGEQITEGETTVMDEEFLGNIMELYEEISLSDKSKVKEIQAENRICLEKCIKEISAAFAEGDIITARQEIIKLKYYTNVAEYIKNQEDWS